MMLSNRNTDLIELLYDFPTVIAAMTLKKKAWESVSLTLLLPVSTPPIPASRVLYKYVISVLKDYRWQTRGLLLRMHLQTRIEWWTASDLQGADVCFATF